MDERCGAETAIEFFPRRAQWSTAARDEIARRCNNVECLRGITYRCGRFDWENKSTMFKVDYLPFSVPYTSRTIDSLQLVPEGGVTRRMVVEMLKVLHCCGHTVLATRGFRGSEGGLVVGKKVQESIATCTQVMSLPRRIEDDYADVQDCCC
jgi:hypothetical protein